MVMKGEEKRMECSKCNEKAIGTYGIGDPDIKPIPLCKMCLMELQIKIFETMRKTDRK